MAVLQRILATKPSLAANGAMHLYYYICDTTAERPTSGLNVGDMCICLDTAQISIASSTTAWAAKIDNVCIPTGTTSQTFVAGNDSRLVPSGLISMWSGLLANIPAGWVLCNGANGTPDLRSSFIKGSAAGVEPGITGGSATITPAGTVSTPTFTGSALGTHSHTAGTLVPSAHAGTAVADHAAHTHSVTSNVTVADHASHTHTYTDVPNHTHPYNVQGSATPATTGGNVVTSTATGGSSRTAAIATSNPSGGVATGTTAGPGAVLTHTPTNNAVTSGNPSATLTHSVTQPSAHTMSGTSSSDSAGTPAGSVSTPTFTGSSHSNEPVFFSLAYIMKV